MGLVKKSKQIELVSKIDGAIESGEGTTESPFVFKEGENPFVFVFKSPLELSVRNDYLRAVVKLQKLFGTNGKTQEELQNKLAEISEDEQVEFVLKTQDIQLSVIRLLLLGYREGLDQPIKEPTDDLIDIMVENNCVSEFFTKIVEVQNSKELEKKS